MIYILEDDESIRNFVSYALNSSGLEAQGFGLPSEFWQAVEKSIPSLVLLDIMLPEQDGLSVLSHLRADAATRDIPVIMLTAKGSEYDRVLGLDSGADDYVNKPFSMMELISRIKALLRRCDTHRRGASADEYVAGKLYLCPSRHAVRVADEEISLTLKEYELLTLLMTNSDMVLSRDVILEKIWGFSFDGESRTVDVHIRTLRSKIGECGELIETVRGVGYKMSGVKLL
ncbi:MAG: response regulator transcription factor [Clostridia bacterium]|nr:response regulator transcription factor [Clostridia bacterium]